MGRAAAILAAVIAGIFSLPAVLAGDAPPPLPPDVGLRPPPATLATPAAPEAAEPPPAVPPATAKRSTRHRHGERRLTRRPDRPSDSRRHPAGKDHGQSSDSETGAAPAPAQIYEPVPSYSSPGPGSEFRFER